MPVTGSLRPIVVSMPVERGNSIPEAWTSFSGPSAGACMTGVGISRDSGVGDFLYMVVPRSSSSVSRRRRDSSRATRAAPRARRGAPARRAAPRQLVRPARAPGQLAHHAHRHLGVVAQHLVEGGAVDLDQLGGSEGTGRGGARHVLQDRHLAEEVTLLQHGDDRLLSAHLVEDLDLALGDDVHLGAEVPLAEDVIAVGEFDEVATARRGLPDAGRITCLSGAARATAGRLEHGTIHALLIPSPSQSRHSSLSIPFRRAGIPRGSVQLGRRCPLSIPQATGKSKPERLSATTPGQSAPEAPVPPSRWPTSMPAIRVRVSESRRWVNIRSTRYGSSLISSQNRIAPSRSGRYGVPAVAESRLRQPPRSGPLTSLSTGGRSHDLKGRESG